MNTGTTTTTIMAVAPPGSKYNPSGRNRFQQQQQQQQQQQHARLQRRTVSERRQSLNTLDIFGSSPPIEGGRKRGSERQHRHDEGVDGSSPRKTGGGGGGGGDYDDNDFVVVAQNNHSSFGSLGSKIKSSRPQMITLRNMFNSVGFRAGGLSFGGGGGSGKCKPKLKPKLGASCGGQDASSLGPFGAAVEPNDDNDNDNGNDNDNDKDKDKDNNDQDQDQDGKTHHRGGGRGGGCSIRSLQNGKLAGGGIRAAGGGDGKKNTTSNTLEQLMERRAWRRVRSRLKTEEGKKEAEASLISVSVGRSVTRSTGTETETETGTGIEAAATPAARDGEDSSASPSPSANVPSRLHLHRHRHRRRQSARRTENILHQALRSGAPVSVLRLLHASCPSLSVEPDTTRGRTPLHVAASPSCRTYLGDSLADVLDAIIEANPSAVWTRDFDGRLPIHLACVASEPDVVVAVVVDDPDDSHDNVIVGPSSVVARRSVPVAASSRVLDLEAIASLYVSAPGSLLCEDDMGRVPIEYALGAAAGGEEISGCNNNVAIDVLDHLLEWVECEWNKKKKNKNDNIRTGEGMSGIVQSRGKTGDEDRVTMEEGKEKEEITKTGAEYRHWMARREPRFYDALREYRAWRNHDNGHSDDYSPSQSLVDCDDDYYDDSDVDSCERAVPRDRSVDMVGVGGSCAGDVGNDGREVAAAAVAVAVAAAAAEDADTKDLAPTTTMSVPPFVRIDPRQNDEWVENELQAELNVFSTADDGAAYWRENNVSDHLFIKLA